MRKRWPSVVAAAVLCCSTAAMAGKRCVTVEGMPAAVSEADLQLGKRLAHDGDTVALRQLQASGRVFALKGGVSVFVEDFSIWSNWQRIRLEGQLVTLWTTMAGARCPGDADWSK